MCGITGFWDLKNIYSSQDLKNIINKMKACLKSRGPDDSGIWIDNKQNLSLGHTRLSYPSVNSSCFYSSVLSHLSSRSSY